ncbi:MAG: protein kinase [Gemmataceae bacterium]
MTRPSPSAPLSGCPRRETLVGFLRGQLSEAELESVAAHLDTCPDCASAVSQLDAGETPDSVQERVRQALASPPAPAEGATTAGTVAAAGATPAVGDEVGFEEEQRVGGYRLLERLGGGGAGVVYRAEQVAVGRPVAVKLLHAVADASDRERFRREAAALARVRHRHAVGLLDYGEHDGVPYLVLELVEGGTLADRLAQGPLDPREAAGLVRDVAGAVAAAHRAGVLHRDLKPDNVLLDVNGCAKVADFGLARLLDADTSALTASGAVVGTPEYLSPEQAGGEAATAATDVWGLGAVLYACLSGRPPVEGADTLDVLAAARAGKVAPLVGVPAGLAAVCLKCLARRPADRYATAEALADDLARWLRGERPQAQRRVGWPPTRWHLFGGVCVLAGLAILLAAFILRRADGAAQVRAERERREQDRRRVDAELARLVAGPAEELLDRSGKPRRMTVRIGSRTLAHAATADGCFRVTGEYETALELCPDPKHERYRLTAEVWHVRRERERKLTSLVGLYVGHQPLTHGNETLHHLTQLAFNDLTGPADSPIALPGARVRTDHGVEFNESLVEHASSGQGVWSTLNGCVGVKFVPAGPGKTGWHTLAVTVTPTLLAAEYDGRPFGQTLARWREVAETQRYPYLLPHLRADHYLRTTRPTFQPRGGLGLYVDNGTAHFRNVRIAPLREAE